MQKLFALITIIFLAGCVQSPPSGQAAVNTFSHIMPLNITTADVQVRDEYQPPLKAPNIEHTMINPLYVAAYNLANQTFKASGANEELNIIIREAQILQTQEPWDGYGLWPKNPNNLYKGYLRADVILKQTVPPYDQTGKGEVKVNRTLKLPDSTSLTQREIALNKMVEEMMRDFHAGLVDVARNKFNIVQPQ